MSGVRRWTLTLTHGGRIATGSMCISRRYWAGFAAPRAMRFVACADAERTPTLQPQSAELRERHTHASQTYSRRRMTRPTDHHTHTAECLTSVEGSYRCRL